MTVTNSKATLAEYLFKQWIMLPDSEVDNENNDVPPMSRLRERLGETLDFSPERFLALMESSIEKAIGERKRIGLFLSGGLDSSTIAILAKKFGKEMIAGTYRYCDDALDYEGISNDYDYTKLLCEREGIDLLTVDAKVEDLETLKELVQFMDSPIADPAIIPSYLVAKQVGQETDIMLSGHGGDEIFGGYSTYRVAINQDTYCRFMPRVFFSLMRWFAEVMQANATNGRKRKFYRDVVRYAEGSRYQFPFNHERYRSYFSIGEINRLVGSDEWLDVYFDKVRRYLNLVKKHISKLQILQVLDVYGTLQSHNLAYTIAACRAANVSVGFPIVDEDLIMYCLNLPDKLKIDNGTHKVILRQSVAKILPREILQRKPAGFAMPIRFWFSKRLDMAVDLLKSPRAIIKNHLNSDEINDILNLHIQDKMDNSMKIWTLLTLELFLQQKQGFVA